MSTVTYRRHLHRCPEPHRSSCSTPIQPNTPLSSTRWSWWPKAAWPSLFRFQKPLLQLQGGNSACNLLAPLIIQRALIDFDAVDERIRVPSRSLYLCTQLVTLPTSSCMLRRDWHVTPHQVSKPCGSIAGCSIEPAWMPKLEMAFSHPCHLIAKMWPAEAWFPRSCECCHSSCKANPMLKASIHSTQGPPHHTWAWAQAY